MAFKKYINGELVEETELIICKDLGYEPCHCGKVLYFECDCKRDDMVDCSNHLDLDELVSNNILNN